MPPTAQPPTEYRGYTASIVVDGDDLLIVRRGLHKSMNRLPAQTRIPLRRITGVVLEPATRLVNGHLTLVLDGREAPALSATRAVSHPETVLFRRPQRQLFHDLYEWLQHVASVNRAHGPQPAVTRPAVAGPTVVGSAVQLAWTPPEEWPDDVSGYQDDDRWRHGLEVPAAPEGHVFWTVTGPPAAVALAHEPVRTYPSDVVAASGREPDEPPSVLGRHRAWAETLSGQVALLNELETDLAKLRREPAEWDEDEDLDQPWTPARAEIEARRRRAWAASHEAGVTARDRLVEAISGGAGVGRAELTLLRRAAEAHRAQQEVVLAALEHHVDELQRLLTLAGGETPTIVTGTDGWQDAERLAAAALRQFGHPEARVTAAGADEGLDVIGPRIAAQVKYTATPVGRPVLQQLQGAAGGRTTAFFSRSGYTSTALTFAATVHMALFTLELPRRVTAVNAQARTMVEAD